MAQSGDIFRSIKTTSVETLVVYYWGGNSVLNQKVGNPGPGSIHYGNEHFVRMTMAEIMMLSFSIKNIYLSMHVSWLHQNMSEKIFNFKRKLWRTHLKF